VPALSAGYLVLIMSVLYQRNRCLLNN